MFQNMKKVELHLHLDGCIKVETACKILNKKRRDLQNKMMVDDSNSSLSEYLEKFKIPNFIMQEQENLTLISKELIEDLKKDHVIYAEIRFSPLLHTKKGLTFQQIIDAILKGLKNKSVKTNLILCMMRNASKDENLKVIELASHYLKKGVVGVDLAGDEAKYPTYLFEDLFQKVNELGIPLTVHAGEVGSSSNIKVAIKNHAKRIGHGIRLVEDPALLELVKKKKITLEICPTSNVQTKAVKNYQAHPIKELIDRGVLISINTDNRTVSNTTLTHEYELLNQYFNLSKKDFIKLNKNAIEASFLSHSEKLELLKKIR